MASLKFLLVALALCLQACNVSGLYFLMFEGDTKCFLEEVPDETLVEGTFRVEVFQPQTNSYVAPENGGGVHVTVKDPEGDLVMDKDFTANGRFTFTSQINGEHIICINSRTERWQFSGNKIRVHLKIEIGEGATDYEEVAKNDKLTHLEMRMRQLGDQVSQIAKEQGYQRVREAKFRSISEVTNDRVFSWSVIQLVLLLCTGVWQLYHLKTFFISKKLV
eukprot:Colp12_sorted_trinity150504_noHs@21936